MRVITLYPDWNSVGGAQNVAITLAKELNEQKPIIICTTNIHPEYQKQNVTFQKHSIKCFLKLQKDDVILSHHRKLTTLYILLSWLFFWKKVRIVHVAHNTFDNLKYLTLFPKKIIAVSAGVKENLITYFGVESERITVISNGLKDKAGKAHQRNYDGNIKILHAGRLCRVKQQVKITSTLKGYLSDNIHIYFAGEGEDMNALINEIDNDPHFHILGKINMYEALPSYDYIMLFSEKEGFGLTLIEGCMYGKPAIVNDIPAVKDIVDNSKTGFIFPTFGALRQNVNNIPLPNSNEYMAMSIHCRDKYALKFTQEKMIDSYSQIIKSLS